MSNQQSARPSRDQARALTSIAAAIRELAAEYRRQGERQPPREPRIVEKAGLLVAAIGLLVAAIGLYFNALLWETTAETLVQTRQQFVIEQQPYIIATKVELRITEPSVGSPVVATAEYSNLGETPALNLRSETTVFVGADAMRRAEAWLRGRNRITGDPVYLRAQNIDEADTVGPINSTPVTQQQLQAVSRVPYGIVVVGRFEYEDLHGNLYQTDFCNATIQVIVGQLPFCPRLNAIRRIGSARE